MISDDKIEKQQVDEGIEKNNETKQDVEAESDGKEIENSEDLEQKKREINEFHAEGNSARNMLNIQDMSGGITINNYTLSKVPADSNFQIKKRYDLEKIEECIEFVEQLKNSGYFTTAIILCIFEAVVLADLTDLKAKLTYCLPEEVIHDDEGTVDSILMNGPYISLNSVLAVIGGKRFVTDDGVKCVSLGENSTSVLFHILEQFPALQDSVAAFFMLLAEEDKYHTAFYEYQIALSLSRLISFKIIDVEDRILPNLYTNSDNVYLLGSVVYNLYVDENKEEANDIILRWIHSPLTWLWQAACFAYALFRENNISIDFEDELKEMLAEELYYFKFKRNDFEFIVDLFMQSKDFRMLICSVFSNVYNRLNTSNKKTRFAQLYLNLVRKSYYRVNASLVELPLVACDTKRQQEELKNILERIMIEYRLRKQIYAILRAYLKELSNYKYSEKVIKHIAAYFYNLALAGEEYKEDILEFLKGCQGRAAKQTADLLCKTYDKRGEK